MTTSLLPLSSLSARDRAAWAELAERTLEPNPFFEPVFAEPAARLPRMSRVGLVVSSRDGAWIGCTPVAAPGLRRNPALASVWGHRYSFLGTPLLARDHAAQAAGELVAFARRHWLALAFRDVGDGAVLELLAEAAGAARLAMLCEVRAERAALELRAEPTYLDGVQGSRRFKELARNRRRLERELGPLELRDRSGEAAAVERFLELEAGGWKGRTGTAMLSSAADAGFFRAICANLAEQGRLELLALEAEGRVLAMRCSLAAGRALFGFKVAFDESLGSFSPGVQLQLASVELFHERRSRDVLDSCSDPDNELLNWLFPDRRRIATAVLTQRWVPERLVRDAGELEARLRWWLRQRRASRRRRRPRGP